jgi:hypothetical protein
MQVYLSSGTHVDEIEDRIAAVTDRLDTLDVVFGEGGEATLRGQAHTIVRLFLRAPLIALAAAMQVFVVLPFGGWLASAVTSGSKGRDLDLMHQLASEYDAEISEIDPVNTAQPIYDRPLLWGVVNWLPTISFPVVLLQRNPLSLAVAHSLLRFVLIGYLLLLIMLYVVNEQREDAMAATIRSRADDVDASCVVLGEAHHVGVGKRLASHDGIDVLNPTPTNPDWTTRIGRHIWGFFDSIRDQ